MRAILMYHSIDDSGSVVSTAPEIFRRHVEWLASGVVRVVTVEEIARVPEHVDAVAITFDDGMRSVGEVAAPLLAAHGLPATVFVVSDAVGRTNRWANGSDVNVPEFPLMGWDDLGRLAEGGVAMGAHTRTHPRLPWLDDTRLHDELAASRDAMAMRLGAPPTAFAYPYGDYDARSERVVAQHYDVACTTELRPFAAAEMPHRLPRLDAFYLRAPGALEAWGSRRQRLRLAARAAGRSLRNQLAVRSR